MANLFILTLVMRQLHIEMYLLSACPFVLHLEGVFFNKYGGCWIAELVELGICALAKIERG